MAESENKVCPKCGMQLVGKNNYCMGCGENIDLYANGGSSEKDGSFVKVYGNGTGYTGPNGQRERMIAARGRRERTKKKDILHDGGLTSMLLMAIGITAGVVCGIFFLKWCFAPKDQTVVLRNEHKVVEVAGVERIDPPEEQAFSEMPDEHGVIDRRNKEDPYNRQTADGRTVRRADPEKQKFKETLVLQSKGDQVVSWTEVQVWDIKNLDPNSVTYIVNSLNYKLDEFKEYVFIECEIVQTESDVTIRRTYRNLDIDGNALALNRLGVVNSEVLKTYGKKQIISLKKLTEALEKAGWKVDGSDGTTVIYVE